ncbi:unnamed protein product, partial [Pleuronectes platessa]
VARLELHYKVKMLIFQQHTPKNLKQVHECEKVSDGGRRGTAPSHGGPQKQDPTRHTAGEEVLLFAAVSPPAGNCPGPNTRCTRKQRQDFHGLSICDFFSSSPPPPPGALSSELRHRDCDREDTQVRRLAEQLSGC